ncbi:MAG: hypothetical protein KKB13_28515 [Chloroflexi bacterium]|nr:hypothetical protein [Chloroflexota bacterium]
MRCKQGFVWIVLLIAGGTLLAGCETGPAPIPTLPATQTAEVATVVITATPSPTPPVTPTPMATATPTATASPTMTATPVPTDTPVPTATDPPRPQPTRTPAPPPTATTPPFAFMPDGPTRHESNPSFTEIRGVVRTADGTPLDGVIVILDTGGQRIPLPTGQRPGYYSWVWCDWARDGIFDMYVLGADGQRASPVIKVQTFSEGWMAIAIQDWKRTW